MSNLFFMVCNLYDFCNVNYYKMEVKKYEMMNDLFKVYLRFMNFMKGLKRYMLLGRDKFNYDVGKGLLVLVVL